ncbi:hypothetical protein EOE67_16235 [Rheinheimera riviphila]|uniref:Uncharacterized protein n=1 Tax=Rheinheimera riviphila TaxID=1834037 RepID=A0A437QGN2_9GAMM|nr:hypothetical protein [Rheinheimera riviphila]RVU33564.1 hypothetical protein EOE67_16235 [Rheinheimera riviphila]
MMQPDKPENRPENKPENAVAQQTVASGQDLLQQALALFDLQPVQPVALVFPNVIGEPGVLSAGQMQHYVGQLFAQQELLFAAADVTEPAPEADAEPLAESAELQAIRQMYAGD